MDYNKGLFCVLLFFYIIPPASADWPTYRGSIYRGGHSSETSNYSFDEIDTLWSYTVGWPIYSSPSVSDINADGVQEVVFGSDDGNLYALDYKGGLLWKYPAGKAVKSPPSIVQKNANESYIFFGSDDGILYSLYGNGSLFWRYDAGSPIRSSPLVADVDETPDLEVIFGTLSGRIYKLGWDGNEKFVYNAGGMFESSPAAVDLDGDNKLEYVIGSDNAVLYIFKTFPYSMWTFQSDGGFPLTPAISGGGVLIGYDDKAFLSIGLSTGASQPGRKFCNGSGCVTASIPVSGLTESWRYNLSSTITTPAALDEFVIFGVGKQLYVLNTTGDKYFYYMVNDRIMSAPSLADIDGDMKSEIIFGSNKGTLYVVNQDRRAVWHGGFNGSIKTSPAIADLTGDGSVEFFFGTEAGVFYAVGSRKRMIIGDGDVVFNRALSFFQKSDFNRTVENAREAYSFYLKANYSQGVARYEELLLKVEAERQYKKAEEHYERGEFQESTQVLNNLSVLCSRLNYTQCKTRTTNLFKRIDADTYMLEAKYYFDAGNFDNSSAYAIVAKGIYQSIGYAAGIKNAEALRNHSNAHKTADYSYSQGLSAYNSNNKLKASDYVASALDVYQQINSTAGIEKAGTMLKRIKADEHYLSAMKNYNSSEYEKAIDYAERALEVYAAINLSSEARKAEELSNHSSSMIAAIDSYNSAIKYYGSTDYRSAIDNAKKAMSLFNMSNNEEGYNMSAILYNKSAERLAMTSGGPGEAGVGGGISEETMLYAVVGILVLVLGFLLLRKRKEEVLVYGLKFCGIGMKDQCRYPGALEGYSLIPEKRLTERLDRRRIKPPEEGINSKPG